MATTLSGAPVEQYTLGALARTTPERLRTLMAFATAAAGAARYTTFREYRAAAGYTVPAGFELILSRLVLSAGAAGQTWKLVDGTTDVGQNSAAAPTDERDLDEPFGGGNNGLTPTTAAVLQEFSTLLRVPAGRLPALRTAFASSGIIIVAYGVERGV